MEKKRYSLRTASAVIGMNTMTLYQRAKDMNIDTSVGITAEDVAAIKNWEPNDKKRARRCSAKELMEELEVLGC